MADAKAIQELKRKRGYTRAALTRVETNVNQLSSSFSEQDALVQLELLERSYNEFKMLDEGLQDYDVTFSEIDEFERRYSKIRAKLIPIVNVKSPVVSNLQSTLNETMERLHHQQQDFFSTFRNTVNDSGIKDEVKLPRINIPTFNGNYADFPSFRDIFESTINSNANLSDVHKLQLLKGLLKDKAAELVKNMSITDSNYSEVWDKIRKRYERKTPVITSLIKQFLDMPPASESVESQRRITDTCDQVVRGLKVLGTEAEARDPWLIYIVLNKLNFETREQWALKTVDDEFPTFAQFLKFLENRCSALENCNLNRKPNSNSKSVKSHFSDIGASNSVASKSQSVPLKCPKCHDSHHLSNCNEFKTFSLKDRMDYVGKNRLCFNCLFLGHSSRDCKSKRRCFTCGRKHHTSLHGHDSTSSQQEAPSTSRSESNGSSILSNVSVCLNPILPTALVKVFDKNNTPQLCRVLLDSGSTSSLISESCMNKLKLPRSNARYPVKGIASKCSVTQGCTEIKLMPHFVSNFVLKVKAFILEKLPSDIPMINRTTTHQWEALSNLILADRSDYVGNIDIILGVSHFFKIMREGQISGPNDLTAQRTALGWIIGGGDIIVPHQVSMNIQVEFNVDEQLRKFWEIEEPLHTKLLSPIEKSSDEYFCNTFVRDSEGKFVLRLPFKTDAPVLGNSFNQALSRFLSIERKLNRNEKLREEYTQFMREYVDLGHMTELTEDDHSIPQEKHFYLPHHPVVKESNLTTKVRVVFDGSARSTSGVSLNECLQNGPTIQPDLISIIMRFRLHKYAVTADIEKMYRQVKISNADANFQRIVWRDDKNKALKHFKLVTVTYGTTSAPYQATRCLKQLAIEHEQTHPTASQAISSDFYVDDFLSGSESVSSAIALCKDVMYILESAGFPLRKWASNSHELLSNLPQNNTENFLVDVMKSAEHKVLGLYWDPIEDVLKFKINLQVSDDLSQTKRKLLSDASRVFDPLGWLTPTTINIKILFQQVWLLHLNWDDPVPVSIYQKWNNIRNTLSILEQLKIKRYLSIDSAVVTVEFHGFSDASCDAYAAVVYCRVVDKFENIFVNLVTSKTRVAPIKQLSIPRLELCGAHLLAKLINVVKENLKLPNIACFAWTDSQIVLHWLHNHPTKWKTFIANRTSEIMTLLPNVKWNHVPTTQNPADCASRGITPTQLLNCDIWWHGPDWLSQSITHWPRNCDLNADFAADILEERKIRINLIDVQLDFIDILFARLSDYTQIRRTLAYVIKYVLKLRSRVRKISMDCQISPTFITSVELGEADILCNRWAQGEYLQEIKDLRANRQITKGKLASLSPFLDDRGIIRVGGRLSNAPCSYSAKHPVILPNTHILSKMILSYIHKVYNHPGPSLLSHLSRQSFWIVNVRKLSRQIINKCLICHRFSASTNQQLMGQLPLERVTRSRPFTHTALDYAGPIQIASKKGRGAKFSKAYISLFVCQAVKAIHLEAVTELTTDAFIAALKRFVSRRGLPSTISCDNGTNFVGAKRKLTENQIALQSTINTPAIQNYSANMGIKWIFSPPSAPHFNGLAEAAVRSVKHHLVRSIGRSNFTFEELSTFLSQTEAILNSRPLTPISEDIEDLEVLTPAHFLTTGNLLPLPELPYDEVPDNRLSRWQEVQKRVDSFWSRYSKEYINNMQTKSKWIKKEPNFEIGDLVLVKENSPPLSWPLGRIVETNAGLDGLVRVVTVKTASTTLKRPIVKLVKLPIEKNANSI